MATDDILAQAFKINQENTTGAFATGLANADAIAKNVMTYDMHLKQQQNALAMKQMELQQARTMKGFDYLTKSAADGISPSEKDQYIDVAGNLLRLPPEATNTLKDNPTLRSKIQQAIMVARSAPFDPTGETQNQLNELLTNIQQNGGDPAHVMSIADKVNQHSMAASAQAMQSNLRLQNQASETRYSKFLPEHQKALSSIYFKDTGMETLPDPSNNNQPILDPNTGKPVLMREVPSILARTGINKGKVPDDWVSKVWNAAESRVAQVNALSGQVEEAKKQVIETLGSIKDTTGFTKEQKQQLTQARSEIKSIGVDNYSDQLRRAQELASFAGTTEHGVRRGEALTDQALSTIGSTIPAVTKVTDSLKPIITKSKSLIDLLNNPNTTTAQLRIAAKELSQTTNELNTSRITEQDVQREFGMNFWQKKVEAFKSFLAQYPEAQLNPDQRKALKDGLERAMADVHANIQSHIASGRKALEASGALNPKVKSGINSLNELSIQYAMDKKALSKQDLDFMYKEAQKRFPNDPVAQEEDMAQHAISGGKSDVSVRNYFRQLKSRKKGRK